MNMLSSLTARFRQYKELAEGALAQLSDAEFRLPVPENENSISVIIRHMHGNMASRFTDFLTMDGEKPWRNRDAEFEAADRSRGELMADWNAGWKCLFDALNGMDDTQLDTTVHIRGEAMTALDAILRQLAHYSYHVGQLVMLCRRQASQWRSLSIPKGESNAYTEAMRSGRRTRDGG